MADNFPIFILVRRSDFGTAETQYTRPDMIAQIADHETWRCEEDVTHVLAVSADGVQMEDRDQLDREVEEYLADMEAARRHRAGLQSGAR